MIMVGISCLTVIFFVVLACKILDLKQRLFLFLILILVLVLLLLLLLLELHPLKVLFDQKCEYQSDNCHTNQD